MASNITSPMGLTKSKFDLKNPRKNLQIVEDNFFKWSNDHMYRTSTHDMQDKVITWCLLYLVPLFLWKRNWRFMFSFHVFVDFAREKESCYPRLSGFRSRILKSDHHWTEIHRGNQRGLQEGEHWWEVSNILIDWVSAPTSDKFIASTQGEFLKMMWLCTLSAEDMARRP